MKTVNMIKVTLLIFACSMLFGIPRAQCQQTMPEVMDTGTLGDQLNYIQERTRIYENYRAIREDIFQKMKTNTMDSVSAAKRNINELERLLKVSDTEINSLNGELQKTKDDLALAIENKDTLSFLGMKTSKVSYNLILWSVILALSVLLVLLFLAFYRNYATTVQIRKDLEETREESEAYERIPVSVTKSWLSVTITRLKS